MKPSRLVPTNTEQVMVTSAAEFQWQNDKTHHGSHG